MDPKKKERLPEDGELTALFFARDEEALRLAERKYGRYLLHIAGRFLDDRQDCEECLNDTLLCAWKSIPPNRPDDLRAYLTVIMRRTAVNLAQAKRAEKRAGDRYAGAPEDFESFLSGGESVEKAFEARQIDRVLKEWLSRAEARKKYIFLARFYFGYPLREIARDLRCSLSTVNKDLSAIRAELKTMLENEGIDI